MDLPGRGGVFTATHLFLCFPGKALGWWMLVASSSSSWVHVGSFFILLTDCTHCSCFIAPSNFITCGVFVLCVICKTFFACFPRSHPSDEQLLTAGELLQRGADCHPAFVLSGPCSPLMAVLLSAPFSQGETNSLLPERATCCFLLVLHVTIGARAHGCTKLSKKQKRIR